MQRRIENGVSQAAAVSAYVDSIESIDVSPLPKNVRLAFHDHRQAWREYAESLESSSSQPDLSSVLNLGQAFARLQGGDPSALLSLLPESSSSEQESKVQSISQTWKDVERAAVESGASLDVSPFHYEEERLVSLEEIEVEQGSWDPNFGNVASPEIRLVVYRNDSRICYTEGEDSHTISPTCRFLARSGTDLRLELEDKDLNQPEHIGTLKTVGKTLLSEDTLSFEAVEHLVVSTN